MSSGERYAGACVRSVATSFVPICRLPGQRTVAHNCDRACPAATTQQGSHRGLPLPLAATPCLVPISRAYAIHAPRRASRDYSPLNVRAARVQQRASRMARHVERRTLRWRVRPVDRDILCADMPVARTAHSGPTVIEHALSRAGTIRTPIGSIAQLSELRSDRLTHWGATRCRVPRGAFS